MTAVRRPQEKDDDVFVITKVIDHTCPQIQHYGWKEGNKAKSIAKRHAVNVEAYRDTKPAQIKSTELATYGNQVSYMQAWRAKGVILREHEGSEAEGFHRIFALLIRATWSGSVPQGDPEDDDEEAEDGLLAHETGDNCLINVTVSNSDEPMSLYVTKARDPNQIVPRYTFLNYLASPSICRLAYRSMRKIIMLDGCHLITQHKLILLVAVGLDGDGQVLPLAWSVVWSENKANWVYFLQHLYEALDHGEGNIDQSIVITDRQKGLIPALKEVFPRTPHYFCIHHIGNNISEEFGQGSRKLFIAAVYATSEAAFKEAMKKIKEQGAEGLWEYVDSIPPDKYARYAIDCRYGHYTSNLAETINSAWLNQRRLPILQGFQALWNYIMDTVYKRRETPPTWKNPRWTNWAWGVFSRELEQARFYYVQRAEGAPTYVAGVWRSTGGKTHTVRLRERKCTCLDFQDLRIPCRHALATCREFKIDGEVYIDDLYSQQSYRNTYCPGADTGCPVFMHPLDLDHLEPDLSRPCLPPPIHRTVGRPQEKRRERGRRDGHLKRVYKCTVCGSLNHRASNCTSKGKALPKNKAIKVTKKQRSRKSRSSQQGQQNEPIIIGSSPAVTPSPSHSRSTSPSVSALGSQLSQSLQVTPVAQRNREISTPYLEAARADLNAKLRRIAEEQSSQDPVPTQDSQEDVFVDAQEEVATEDAPEASRTRMTRRTLPEFAPNEWVPPGPPSAAESSGTTRRPLEQAPKRLLISRAPQPRASLLCAQEDNIKALASARRAKLAQGKTNRQ